MDNSMCKPYHLSIILATELKISVWNVILVPWVCQVLYLSRYFLCLTALEFAEDFSENQENELAIHLHQKISVSFLVILGGTEGVINPQSWEQDYKRVCSK